jgi:hypothetical protein
MSSSVPSPSRFPPIHPPIEDFGTEVGNTVEPQKATFLIK